MDQISRTRQHAEAALSLMEERDIPPSPNNFSVWYAYFAGNVPDLKPHLEKLLNDGTVFTYDVNRGIHEKFFDSEKEREQLFEASDHIEKLLTSVTSIIGAAKKGADEYEESLNTLSGNIDMPDEAQLKSVISSLVAETQKMAEANKEMGSRLANSTKEISKLRQDLDEVRHEARTDALTGIPNRKVFDMTLRNAAEVASAEKKPLCLLMIDIDHFKRFNDTFGHQLGDLVLKLVAMSIVENVKGKDTAARYGGEEFAVILPDTALKNAQTVAEQIRSFTEKRKLSNRKTGEKMGTITMSLGVSEYIHNEELSKFIERADEALYMAKEKGRNRVVTQNEFGLLSRRLK